ncbi:Fusaric acid resistance protein-like [bacterium A37T11]|nr:Fusaric acid resistance protein-like [bacterium A37T11]
MGLSNPDTHSIFYGMNIVKIHRLNPDDWLYILKCIIGVTVCYAIYRMFPQYPIYWSIISVVIVFTPDNDRQLAFDRIKANILGSGIGILVYFIPLPNFLLFILGVALTSFVGIVLGLGTTIRPALAAVIIVLIEEQNILEKAYVVAIERVLCVLLGCTVALIITLVFSQANVLKVRMRYLRKQYRRKGADQ